MEVSESEGKESSWEVSTLIAAREEVSSSPQAVLESVKETVLPL